MCSKNLHRLLIALACLALQAGPANACSQAVFDYALTKWQAEPYILTLFHSGKLQPGQQAVIDEVRQAISSGANIDVQLVDISAGVKGDIAKLWKQCQGKPLPYVVVDTPYAMPSPGHVWAGELKDFNAGQAYQSALRSKIAEGIAAGDSAVWVLLESQNKDKDSAARATLARQLARLEKELKLPSDFGDSGLAPTTTSSTAASREPGLKFPLLCLSKADPGEEMLVRMFHAFADQNDTSEPMAFVVFGQGRFLGPIVGKDINDDAITELCALLAGECSCQVQDASPGMQLLMAVDWGAVLESRRNLSPDIAIAPLASLPEPTSQATQAAQASQASVKLADVFAPAPGGTMGRNMVILAILAGAILAGGTAWMLAKSKRVKAK
jgi:hypothetical protein